jgi:hypothetical protein
MISIIERETSIDARKDDQFAGTLQWVDRENDRHIQFLYGGHPRVLLALMAKFRSRCQRDGTSRVTFEVSPGNRDMPRLVELLKATRMTGIYDMYEIDMNSYSPKHQAGQ